MSKRTITRADIADAVLSKSSELSRSDASKLVDDILDTVIASLEKKEAVKLSSFGTFNIREKKQRIGRNPKTGEEAVIKPRTVVSFSASPVLKDIINNP